MRKTLLYGLMAAALPYCAAAKNEVSATSPKSSLHFQENKGQVIDQFNKPRTDIDFSIGNNGLKVFVGDGALHYQFSRIVNKPNFKGDPRSSANADVKMETPLADMYRMDVELLNANKNALVITEQKQDYLARYYQSSFSGRNSKATLEKSIEAASYDKVTYKNIYPNIDWVLFVNNNAVEYEFVVHPGGNPADIKLQYKGSTSLRLNEDGSLTATTPMGTITEAAPTSFQADGKNVASSFNLSGDILSFNVAQYTGTLTIDPLLSWGTYFGDVGTEEFKAVAYDGAGTSLFYVGYTSSTTNMATTGAFQTTNAGAYDVILTRIDTNGTLQWSTFYGTTGNEVGWDAHFNGQDVVLAGYTDAFGDLDMLQVKFTPTGGNVYGYAYGDTGDEICYQLERDASNNVYMGGRTTLTTNLIITVGQTVFGGGTYDGILVKTDNSGTFTWGTYMGGPTEDAIITCDVDIPGNVYAGGWSNSTSGIATIGTSQQTLGGAYDGFITKFNSAGVKTWGTYFGGTSDENILGADVDGNGNIYVTGLAASTGLASNGAYQSTMNGVCDVIIARYNTSGISQWCTYLGGSAYDEGSAVKISPSNDIFVVGYVESSTNVATTNSYDVTLSGTSDGFLCKLASTGAMDWSTYYGGSGFDWMNGVAADNVSRVYVAGYTESSTDIALNTTIQTSYAGSGDAVAARFLDCTLPAQPGNINGSATICAGSTQTYSIAAVTGATSYTWTLPGGWSGTSTTNSISVTAGTAGGTISVTANNTCGSSTPQTLTVTVNPIPTPNVTANGPTTFCQGGNVTLTSTQGTGYTYQWHNGSGPINGATNPTYTANATGTYHVVVTANGCSGTSNSITVTVNPAPATPTASSNSPVCVGDAINFTGNTSTTGVTYDWTGPNNFPNTQNPTIATAVAGDAGTYTLTVTDGNNCTATATTTVVVAPGAPATPSVITGPDPICEGTTNTYSVVNDVNASQYNWTLPGGWSGTSTTNSISATAGNTGGTISVTAQNNCGTSSPSTLNVTVNANPTPNISQSGNVLSTGTTYTTYQWYDGSGMISGATNQNYTPTQSGSYYVVVTDANGCTGTSNTITVTLGVNGLSKATNISLFPNPNTGSFAISGTFAANNGKADVEVIDIAGRVVHKEQVTIKSNAVSTEIKMNANLAAGVYTLKMTSDVQTAVVPFVKK